MIVWQATIACTDAVLGVNGKTELQDSLAQASSDILGSDKLRAAVKDAFLFAPVRNASPRFGSFYKAPFDLT